MHEKLQLQAKTNTMGIFAASIASKVIFAWSILPKSFYIYSYEKNANRGAWMWPTLQGCFHGGKKRDIYRTKAVDIQKSTITLYSLAHVGDLYSLLLLSIPNYAFWKSFRSLLFVPLRCSWHDRRFAYPWLCLGIRILHPSSSEHICTNHFGRVWHPS